MFQTMHNKRVFYNHTFAGKTINVKEFFVRLEYVAFALLSTNFALDFT